MSDRPCPFCTPDPDRVFYRGQHVIALWDGFPVTDGHALLVPIRPDHRSPAPARDSPLRR